MDIPEAGADTPAAAVLTLTTVADIPAVEDTRVAGVIVAVESAAPWAEAGSDSPGAADGAGDAALAAWAARAGD